LTAVTQSEIFDKMGKVRRCQKKKNGGRNGQDFYWWAKQNT